MLALIEAVAMKKNVVLGKLDIRITAQVKNNAWESVTKEVVGRSQTEEQLQEKGNTRGKTHGRNRRPQCSGWILCNSPTSRALSRTEQIKISTIAGVMKNKA
ncbi:uncharacterized protein LOC125047860 [Penaeus chinensis]|uniref:uncharacterized protein LOC125047860 n=1 Tax=Penaeus chinensis TaxID=139456 RepID=UPI001FB59C7E|nr:uncharacterized protein LOC125047860 [Penaeus chinensis]